MGMFNYVKYKCACPNCGEEVTVFQTNNGDCTLKTVTPKKAKNFYSSCPSCETWINCKYIKPKKAKIKIKFELREGNAHKSKN